MKKKLISIMLTAAMAVSLCACGDSGSGNTGNSSSAGGASSADNSGQEESSQGGAGGPGRYDYHRSVDQ